MEPSFEFALARNRITAQPNNPPKIHLFNSSKGSRKWHLVDPGLQVLHIWEKGPVYTLLLFKKKSSITQRLKVKHAGKSVGDIKFSIFPPECLLFSCKVNQILSSGRWELYESLKSAKQTLFPHTLTWLL